MLIETFFGRKFLLVAKSFRDYSLIIFIEKFCLFGNFLYLQNNFLEINYPINIFTEKYFGQNFLSLQNHFLENSYKPKILIENFLV